MMASVHAGSISKKPSQPVFHWPAAFILSQTGVAAFSFGPRLHTGCLRLFQQNGCAQAARMDRQQRRDLEDHQDLFTGRAGFECAANVAASSAFAQVRAAAFTATLISSTSLRGKMLLVHGLSDILRHWSTQTGSHSRTLASAGPSHGSASTVGCRTCLLGRFHGFPFGSTVAAFA